MPFHQTVGIDVSKARRQEALDLLLAPPQR